MHSGYAHICVSVCVFVIISLHVGRRSIFWFLCASRLWVCLGSCLLGSFHDNAVGCIAVLPLTDHKNGHTFSCHR